MQAFDPQVLSQLFKPAQNSTKTDNGQVTIIGGSSLFHGAPLLALKTASRIVDMVYFASPEPTVGKVAENLKSQLSSFIWVPWNEVGEYVAKSDAVLIGPGMMRYRSESRIKKHESRNKLDEAGLKTKEITERLLRQFPDKRWVIDGGSLQVIEEKLIPKNAILTPNEKEFKLLFNLKTQSASWRTNVQSKTQMSNLIAGKAKEYNCIIVLKQAETIVCSPDESVLVNNGNAGLTKGGTGDVLAGLTVALAAKNPPFLAASSAAWIWKKAADELSQKVGFSYNADDLAEKIPEVFGKLQG